MFIGACLTSVLNSSYTDLEAIVINDGSKDETSSIVRAYSMKDSRVVLIEQDNAGVSAARNAGLDRATGEFFMFIDADDLLPVDAIELLLRIANKENGDIVSGDHANVERNFDDSTASYRGKRNYEYCKWVGTEAVVKTLEDHPATYAVWGKLYRRSCFEQLRFTVGKRVHEDSFFVFQCLLRRITFIVIPDVVYYYRVNESSVTHQAFSDKYKDILYFTSEKERLIRQDFPELAPYLDNLVIKANLAILRNTALTFEREYWLLEKRCINEVRVRKQKFVPALKSDKVFFHIVCSHFYYPYKLYCAIRKALK